MKCAFCQTKNGPGSNFCSHCGSPLNLQICLQCENINEKMAGVCVQCGHALTVSETPVFDNILAANEVLIPAFVDAPAEPSMPSADLKELLQNLETEVDRQLQLEAASTTARSFVSGSPGCAGKGRRTNKYVEHYRPKIDAVLKAANDCELEENERTALPLLPAISPPRRKGTPAVHKILPSRRRPSGLLVLLLGGVASAYFLLPLPSQTVPMQTTLQTNAGKRAAPNVAATPATATTDKTATIANIEQTRNGPPEIAVAATEEQPASKGSRLIFAVSPWGKVYIDGKPSGVTPPLAELHLSPGKHSVEIRNANLPPYQQRVELRPGKTLRIKHKFPMKVSKVSGYYLD